MMWVGGRKKGDKIENKGLKKLRKSRQMIYSHLVTLKHVDSYKFLKHFYFLALIRD